MLNLSSIMIGTSQVKQMAAFYEKVLGRPADMVEGDWHGWQIGECFLSIGSHSEVPKEKAKEPQRIILNFETTEVEKEFERLKQIGAHVVKEPYDLSGAMIATLADPDGNYFQLMSPWEEVSN